MNRINILKNHLTYSNGNKEDNISSIERDNTASFFRTSTVMEPNVLDSDREQLPCKSEVEREAWLRYFISSKPGKDEIETYIDESNIEGIVPKWLEGSFFRNGPGLFELGGERIHMADGDGLLVRISIKNGKIHYASKYLRTNQLEQELKENRILYRPSYGTSNAKGYSLFDHFRRNVANLNWKPLGNTNHLDWGNEFSVLHEVACPILVDPRTLELKSKEEWLISDTLLKGEAFSAHYRIDNEKKRLLNFGMDYRTGRNGMIPLLSLWEYDESYNLIYKHEIKLKGISTLHSFAATKNYMVIMVPPVAALLSGFGYYLGWGVDEVLEHDRAKKYGLIYVVPREPKRKVNHKATVYKCVNWWPNHHVSAYEDANGDIIMNSCMYEYKTKEWIERGPFDLAPTHLVQYKMAHSKHKDIFNEHNPDKSELWATHEIIYEKDCEMPIINPNMDLKPHRYLYMVDMQCKKLSNDEASKKNLSHKFGSAFEIMPWTGVIKYDFQTRKSVTYRPGGFCGEVVFVPKPNAVEEDDGVLLGLYFDPVKLESALFIYDAKQIENGPLAKIHLPRHIPFSFHCGWTQHYGPQ